MTPEAEALLLIQEIRTALARGTKHYSQAGKLLATELEIVQALRDEGEITFEPGSQSCRKEKSNA